VGACGMLDQVISFADSVDSGSVVIRIDKGAGTLLVTADKAPGIQFSIAALRTSKGGIANDHTAINALNGQLGNTRAATPVADKESPKDCDAASHVPRQVGVQSCPGAR
jgi:hypothetical protein